MRAGVTLVDPDQTYVDATVDLGRDVTVYPGTMLRGTCTIGEGAEIGPEAHLTDTVVAARARVSQTVTDRARTGDAARLGPWADLAPAAAIPPATCPGPPHPPPP